MKRACYFICVMMMVLAVVGCSDENSAEREYREAKQQAEQLENSYNDAKNRADDFRNDVKDYQNAVDAIR